MTKYQKFQKDFKASGLTQKAYALKIGKAPSVVRQYLKKSRGESSSNDGFSSLSIDMGDHNTIKITTSRGTIIEIPG